MKHNASKKLELWSVSQTFMHNVEIAKNEVGLTPPPLLLLLVHFSSRKKGSSMKKRMKEAEKGDYGPPTKKCERFSRT